jgi:hypothetical protein
MGFPFTEKGMVWSKQKRLNFTNIWHSKYATSHLHYNGAKEIMYTLVMLPFVSSQQPSLQGHACSHMGRL